MNKQKEEWEIKVMEFVCKHNREYWHVEGIDTKEMKKLIRLISDTIKQEKLKVIEEIEKCGREMTDGENDYFEMKLKIWNKLKKELLGEKL